MSSDEDSDNDLEQHHPEEEVEQEMEESDSDDEPASVAQASKASTLRRTADDEAGVPPKLITRLLYEGFEDKSIKIGKEALAMAGKYVDTFVKEALARAIFERDEGGRDIGDDFLQVCLSREGNQKPFDPIA